MEADILKWVWRSIQWLRGVIAAISLVALLDLAFGWERAAFLEFTHAIVTHWNWILTELLQPVAEALGLLPATPLRTNSSVALFLVTTYVIAWAWDTSSDERLPRWLRRSTLIAFIALIILSVCSLLLIWKLEGYAEWDARTEILGVPAGILNVYFIFGFLLFGLMLKKGMRRQISLSILFGIGFVATLELLYLVPAIASWTEGFVEAARNRSLTEYPA